MTFPVLWLHGPPGVGKSMVGWALFKRLSANGTPTGYVDIDQLGMCYGRPTAEAWAPEPADDPARYRLKERNLAAVIANYQRAGARGLIVSGIADPVRGVDPGQFPDAALTPVRLRGDADELRRPVAGRGRDTDNVDEILAYAAAMDAHGPAIDTTGRSVAEVLDLLPGWPPDAQPAGPPGPPPGPGAATGTPGRILWLCGPTAVGKSTVGFAVYQQANRHGIHTAFVDLDQVGFHRPATEPGNHRLKAANLAAIWPNFRAAGAEQLVVVGPVSHREDRRIYEAVLPAATITVARLHAGRHTLAERVRRRGRGLGPPVAGDDLVGQPDSVLRAAADRAATEADALEAAGIGDYRIETDGRSVLDIAVSCPGLARSRSG